MRMPLLLHGAFQNSSALLARLLLKNLEALVGRSRVLARSQIEFATKFEAFRATRVLIYLDDVASVEVSKQRSTSLILLFEVLPVDRDSVSRASPDAHIQLFKACPILVLLRQLLNCLGTVAARGIPEDDESGFWNAGISALIVYNRVVRESSP